MPDRLPKCEYLSLDQRGFHLTITFDRPEARNAMNVAMVRELEAVFEAASANPAISAIVLRGAGKHFCAGGDLKDMTDALAPPSPGEEDALFWVNRRFGDLLTRVDQAPQVIISVVHGAARGGGFGLVCVCDIVIARADATFAMPETGLGLPPAQILPFVAMRLGRHRARRMALTGKPMTGEEAGQLGLVHYVCAEEAAAEAALKEVLGQVKDRGPAALTQAKHLINQVGRTPLSLLLDEGARLVAKSSRSGEGHEGLTAFTEKRPPAWATRKV